MGYWGLGAFESDTAYDFLGSLRDLVTAKCESIFKKDIDDVDSLTKFRCAALVWQKMEGEYDEIPESVISEYEALIKSCEKTLKDPTSAGPIEAELWLDWKGLEEMPKLLKAELSYLKGEGEEPESAGLFATIFEGLQP